MKDIGAVSIVEIRNDRQARAAERLAWDFVGFLRDRYPEMSADIDAYLEGQRFAERMADVRKDYGPPSGEALLALDGEVPVGLVMMRDLGGGDCEMNRMFVVDAARGKGIGRALAVRLIGCARETGYLRMRLSALHRHDKALGLYRSLGFGPDSHDPLDGSTESAVSLVLDLTRGKEQAQRQT